MRRALAAIFFPLLAGCMIGPDYRPPEVPTAADWMESGADSRLRSAADTRAWWTAFGDPILDALVETAYRQNPTLRSAGSRVLESLARRGIAIGTLFPQTQEGQAAYEHVQLSQNRANQQQGDHSFNDWTIGFDAAWELDVWGKIRRSIETEDARILGAVATYDDVLVSLIAEVASNYIAHRTLEERLAVARNNVGVQEKSFGIADEKFRGGATSQLDSLQAATLVADTRTLIPRIEAGIRQSENNLCLLLGIPPRDLGDLLGAGGTIPIIPAAIALGIPADLLRRRPDVRRAERDLAAQSAQIGVAKADLLPSFTLTGTLQFGAEDFVDLFEGRSFEAFGGPQVRWAILNYGRIASNIRVQDARFQALIADYENIVLRAQTEVENAIAGFLGTEREVEYLTQSVKSASAAVGIADAQYGEGAVDYTRVLDTQQSLVNAEDRLVTVRGEVAQNLVALYKALGGGWELRVGRNFLPDESQRQMEDRTRWGPTITTQGQQADVDAASSGTEGDHGWWRWRAWWPKW